MNLSSWKKAARSNYKRRRKGRTDYQIVNHSLQRFLCWNRERDAFLVCGPQQCGV
jgi:hypothetical protein